MVMVRGKRPKEDRSMIQRNGWIWEQEDNFMLKLLKELWRCRGLNSKRKRNGKVQRRTSTPGVQQCVHMLLSLLRMMQYCINHVEIGGMMQ